MASEIWVLRVGLLIELLGAGLLAFDLLVPRIRKKFQKIARQSSRAMLKFWQFTNRIFQAIIIMIFILGEFAGILNWYSESVHVLLEVFLELNIRLVPNIQFPISMFIILYMLLATVIYILHPLPTTLQDAILYSALNPMNFRELESVKSTRAELKAGGWRGIKNYLAFLSTAPLLLFAAIGYWLVAYPVAILGLFIFILIGPLLIGFWLEHANIISLGVRLGGLFLLSLGFILQIIYTFV